MSMPWKLCLPLLAALPALATEITAPSGGWNRSGLVDKSGQAAVAYPYSPIDRGAQTKRSIIKGRIAAAANQRPHQLIVNGNPMPLMTDTEGRYAHPQV